MSVERRRHTRVRLDDGSGIELSLGAEVLDISMSGMGVRTTRKLTTGDTLSLALGPRPDTVALTGTVVWCQRCGRQHRVDGRAEQVYEAGVGFETAGDEIRSRLAEFLAHNAVVEPDERIVGSYRIEDPDGADAEDEHGFSVRCLSVSGLTLDAQAAVAPGSVVEVMMPIGGDEFYSCGTVTTVVDTLEQDGRRLQIGVEFLATAPRHREALERYIRGMIGAA